MLRRVRANLQQSVGALQMVGFICSGRFQQIVEEMRVRGRHHLGTRRAEPSTEQVLGADAADRPQTQRLTRIRLRGIGARLKQCCYGRSFFFLPNDIWLAIRLCGVAQKKFSCNGIQIANELVLRLCPPFAFGRLLCFLASACRPTGSAASTAKSCPK